MSAAESRPRPRYSSFQLWLVCVIAVVSRLIPMVRAVAEGDVSTLAGVPGVLGTVDGGPGTGKFSKPSDLVAAGTVLYVADMANCAIRQVDTSSGHVTTLSGVPGTCQSVDGAVGVARFRKVRALVLSGTDLYVADAFSHAIRVVDTTDGSVTTLSGVLFSSGAVDGAAGTGKHGEPSGLALSESDGLLYVSDASNHAIRVVDTADGSLTTLTGTLGSPGAADGAPGTALFDSPLVMELSDSGDTLYVVDKENHAIRSINRATGDVTTFAGVLGTPGTTDGALGTHLLSFPEGLAKTGNRLYISSQSHVVRVIDITTQVLSTVTGQADAAGYTNGVAGAAQFDTPRGVAVSSAGDKLYVADTLNHAIREVVIAGVTCHEQPATEFGEVCTAAGVLSVDGTVDGAAGIAKLDGPHGLAVSGTDVYLAEFFGCAIRKMDTTDGSTSIVSGVAGSCGAVDGAAATARFGSVAGLAVSGTTLYVADNSNNCIRAIDTVDGSVSTFSGALGSSGTADGPAGTARFNGPAYLVILGDNLYVSDALNHAIRTVSLTDGSVTTLAGLPGTSGAVDSNTGSPRFSNPSGLALSPDGSVLYVADKDNHAIRAVALDTAEVTTYAGVLGTAGAVDGPLNTNEMDSPMSLACVGDRLYFGSDHAVRVVDRTTQEVHHVTGLVGTAGGVDGPSGTAEFNQPADLALSEDGGALYVADVHNHAVRKVLLPGPTCSEQPLTSDYEVCLLSGQPGVSGTQDGAAGLATFSTPSIGLAWDESSRLYVADTESHVIRCLDARGGSVWTLTGDPGVPGSADGSDSVARFNMPKGLALSGATLYVADTDNHLIRSVSTLDGHVTTLTGIAGSSGQDDGAQGTATFNGPTGLALNGDTLYVSDQGNHAVRAVSTVDGSVSTLAGTLGTAGAVDGAAGTSLLSSPAGVALAGDVLYVADSSNHAIRAVDVSTGSISTVAGSLGSAGAVDGLLGTNRLDTPSAVALHGTFLYLSGGGHALRRMELSTGDVTTQAGDLGGPGAVDGLGASARFSSPQGLLVAGNNVYVSDSGNSAIRKVQLPAATCSGAGDVCTLAGVLGHNEYVDGSYDAAKLGAGEHMTISGSSLYISDTLNCAVRVVNTGDGSISSLTPTNNPGCGAADGDAATAMFDRPSGLALSGTSLYVADFNNHAVRVVDITDGSVTTLSGTLGTYGTADGSASAALFDGPSGVALSGTSLYVVDSNNHAIRVVDTTDGSVMTLTGTKGTSGAVDGAPGTALFNGPTGLVLYGAALLVADFSNNAIRSVDTATGDVSTLAGSLGSADQPVDGTAATARMLGPYALAVVEDTLYVVGHDSAVRSVNIPTSAVTTFAGALSSQGAVDGNGGAARLNHPQGIAVSGTDMYVMDALNYVVRRLVLPTPSPAAAAGAGLCAARYTSVRCRACSCGRSIKERMIARIGDRHQ